MATSTKFVSPSRIARYYFQECARYLRYSSTPKEALASEGVPPAPFDHRPVTAAIFESGYSWEERVIEEHLAGHVRLAESLEDGGATRDRVFSAEASRDEITALAPEEWL